MIDSGSGATPRPPDGLTDPDRLAALESYAILDTPPEQGYDDIVRLTTRLCATPIALVSFVAGDRQWFKARINFPECETELDRSVCAYALDAPDLLVIPDLAADPRTASNPLVARPPYIRFYAGAPLRTAEGQVLGSLCAIDTEPRPGGLTPDQAEDLRALANQVMAQLEMRRALARRDEAIGEQRLKLRQAMRLDVVAKASLALVSAQNPAVVLEPILAADASKVGFDQCFIYDLAPDGSHLRLTRSIGATGVAQEIHHHENLDDAPLCAIVARTGQPLVLSDVQASAAPEHAVARALGVNGYAGYPILSRGELVGVVSFATAAPAFDEDALSFFVTLARLMSGVRERMDGETAVRESDRRSRMAQEAGRVGTFEIDLATGVAAVSPELCAIYGLPEAEFCPADRLAALTLPEDRDSPADGANPRGAAEERDAQFRIRRAGDGALRWVTRNARFETDAAGTPLRLFGTVQDITEQRAMIEDLARTEEQLRLAAAATRIGVFDYDPLSDQLRWDAHVRELFGIAADTPIGYDDTFLVGVHPDDQARVDAEVRGALDPAGPGVFDTEYRVRPANNAPELWLAARGQAVVREGRAVRFVGTVRDITSRRRAQEELRQTEERYRLAVRATNDAIWDWDLVRDHVLWNEALTQAHGHLPETVEATGAWWLAHIHPEDRTRVSDGIHAVIDDGAQSTWTSTYRFLRADGRYAAIIDRGFVIRDRAGRATRMIGAMLDVSKQAVSDARKTALVLLGDRLREASSSAEAVGIAAEILGTTLEASRAGYARVDLKTDLLEVERDWTAPGVASLEGRHGLDLFRATLGTLRRGRGVVSPDVAEFDASGSDGAPRDAVSRVAAGACAQIKVPLMERGELVGVLFAHQTARRDWEPGEVGFARAVSDRTYAALAKLQAEAEQRLLNEELSHRLKNTLAMVLSIASQTLRRVPDRAPVEAFEQRVHALSTAHDVLLRRSWAEAPIAEVVRAVMAGSGHADRIEVTGPDFELGPRATLSLSLLLHELATNAVKYGALSTPTGRVAVTWAREGARDAEEMVLDWRERGGPSVRPPADGDRKGFGSRLIRMGLVGTGGVELRYPETGFEATMRAPLTHLQRS